MNEQRAMEWADALESGQYKKGVGALRRGSRFCCLGVACNLHAQAHPVIAARQVERDSYMGKFIMPPVKVCKWMGLHSDAGARRDGELIDINGKEYISLAGANDAGVSFKAIAAYIRANWKAL